MEEHAPRQVGPARALTLTGKLIPFYNNGQPVLMRLPMCETYFLPLFDTSDELNGFLATTHIAYDRIKQVEENYEDFLASLAEAPVPIKLMVNPRYVNGKPRYFEVDPRNAITITP